MVEAGVGFSHYPAMNCGASLTNGVACWCKHERCGGNNR